MVFDGIGVSSSTIKHETSHHLLSTDSLPTNPENEVILVHLRPKLK
jgi:hypothetical protein